MSTREFCLTRRKAEIPTFTKVLKAVPQGARDYRPAPKSRTAAELAAMLAASEAALLTLLETGTVQWQEPKAPAASIPDIVAAYEKSANAVNQRLERLDETGWTKKGRLVMEGAPPWEDTIENFVWGWLFDSVHHRGQLTTYLRPMGGKVPSIYGPSADDPGGT